MPAVLYTRERKALEYISQYIQRNGYAPTLAEIAEALGLSAVSTVHELVQRLVYKGFLRKTQGYERGLELTDVKAKKTEGEMSIELPVLGFIAAGAPLEPHTDPNMYMPVPSSLMSAKTTGFILQVKGTSMIEDGILDGDYVVVEHQSNAKNGDIVVAVLPNGLATLKRIFYEKDRIKLSPANATMAPIYATEVKIQGRVVAMFRKFVN